MYNGTCIRINLITRHPYTSWYPKKSSNLQISILAPPIRNINVIFWISVVCHIMLRRSLSTIAKMSQPVKIHCLADVCIIPVSNLLSAI